MTGIVGMERFMKRCWFVCVIEFTACAKPLLLAEMIMFYKCKSSPQFERNHAVHVTRQCFSNGTSPLWFTQRSVCIHPESEPHQASFASKVRPVLSVDEHELSHPSRWSRLSWEMNSWLFKARKLWRTNTLRPGSEVHGFGALQPAKPANGYKDGDQYKTTGERPVMTSDADFIYWGV